MDWNIDCKICGKTCKGQVASAHLNKIHQITTKQYETLYGSSQHPEFRNNQRKIGSRSAGSPGLIIAGEKARQAGLLIQKSYEENPKLCQHCANPISYKSRRNIYCSQTCSALCNNPRRAKTGNCRCGTVIGFRRTYCSSQCQANARFDRVIEDWLASNNINRCDEFLSKPIRRYLIDQANHACTLCGWNKINPKTGNCPLHIDHINGDCTDHSPKNLRVICPNCHSLTETYGALNRDNKGRTVRRKERLKEMEDHEG